MTRVTRHEMPNGEAVYYDDSKHAYWSGYDPAKDKCSGRLTGVTTVVKPFDFSPDALLGWAAKMTRQGIATLAAEGLGLDDAQDMRASLAWLQSQETIYGALTDAHLRHTDKRDDAATRGTNVHDVVLNALANGASVPDMPSLTEEEQGYAQGLIGWWLDRDPEPEHAEIVVCDLHLGVAGRLDMIATIGGKRTLVDLKTSSGIRTTAHVQTRGYEQLALASGYGPVDDVVIVLARADGTFYEAPCEAVSTDFENALSVYRASAAIKRKAGAAERRVAA